VSRCFANRGSQWILAKPEGRDYCLCASIPFVSNRAPKVYRHLSHRSRQQSARCSRHSGWQPSPRWMKAGPRNPVMESHSRGVKQFSFFGLSLPARATGISTHSAGSKNSLSDQERAVSIVELQELRVVVAPGNRSKRTVGRRGNSRTERRDEALLGLKY